ncbi:hypothetical protein ACFX1S_043539 [Malus domestica]
MAKRSRFRFGTPPNGNASKAVTYVYYRGTIGALLPSALLPIIVNIQNPCGSLQPRVFIRRFQVHQSFEKPKRGKKKSGCVGQMAHFSVLFFHIDQHHQVGRLSLLQILNSRNSRTDPENSSTKQKQDEVDRMRRMVDVHSSSACYAHCLPGQRWALQRHATLQRHAVKASAGLATSFKQQQP